MCAVGGVGNIFMLLIANLIGFVVGVDSVKYVASELFGTIGGKLKSSFAYL